MIISAPYSALPLLNNLKDKHLVEVSLDPTGFYRNLKKMEKDGYISVLSDSYKSKGRKVFQITDFGRESLKSWMGTLEKYETHINKIIDGIKQTI